MLFLYISVQQLNAQNLTDFTKIEGLNSNVVYCVMQDSKGFIWIGTGAGVSRFDGYNLKHFTTDDGLSDDDIFQIREDANGRIWFLNNSGKPCIYDHGKILNLHNTDWLKYIQPKKLSIHFSQEKNNCIWYASLDTVYKIIDNKVVNKLTINWPNQQQSNILSVFHFKDSIFLLTNYGLYNPISKKILRFDPDKFITSQHSKSYQFQSFIYYFTDNRLLVYDLLTKKNQEVFRFTKDDAGLVFIPTKNRDTVIISSRNELLKLNIVTRKIINLETKDLKLTTSLFYDKEGNLWYGSLANGLYIKKVKTNENFHIVSMKNLPKELSCNMFSNTSNRLYIGFDKGYFLQIEKNDFLLNKMNLVGNVQRTSLFFQETEQNIWCAATTKLIRKEKKSGKEFEISIPAKSVLVSEKGLYIASSEGIYFIKKEDFVQQNKKLTTSLQRISTQRASGLLLKNKDTVFSFGILGMQMFVNQKLVPLPWQSEILNTHIHKASITNSNNILLATTSGIGIVTNDSVYLVRKIDGLLSNNCKSIYAFENNKCWIVTSRGINILSYAILPNKSIKYEISTLELSKQISNSKINDIVQRNDTLFIGTDNGLIIHQLFKTKHSYNSPTTYIEYVKVRDSLYYEPHSIDLKYWQNQLQINFVAPSFNTIEKLKYRYKLLPIDTNWKYTENNIAEYPLLPSGKYTFIVSASITGNEWSTHQATIDVNIQYPFWKQVWFYIFVFIIVVLLVFASIKYLLKVQEKKHDIEKQILMLESKALRLQMNPHFIFNTINGIKGYYASGNIQDAKNYIDTFSSLMRLMLETGNDTFIQLSNEIKIIENYLQLCSLRYNQQFTFSIHQQLNHNVQQLYIPIMIIQPFVENAVQHGVASLPQNGHINISFKQEKNLLCCQIDDNGIGRKKAKEYGKHRLHNSKGIQITQQRLLLMGVENAVKIIDKVDEFGTSLGTLVELMIPLSDNNSI